MNHEMIDAPNSTTTATVMTLEIDFHARRSPSSARRSTKTGMNVADGDPTEHEVKEHVRHRVGQVERVSERREPEHPGEHEHAQQAGQARDERAARHGGDA